MSSKTEQNFTCLLDICVHFFEANIYILSHTVKFLNQSKLLQQYVD